MLLVVLVAEIRSNVSGDKDVRSEMDGHDLICAPKAHVLLTFPHKQMADVLMYYSSASLNVGSLWLIFLRKVTKGDIIVFYSYQD